MRRMVLRLMSLRSSRQFSKLKIVFMTFCIIVLGLGLNPLLLQLLGEKGEEFLQENGEKKLRNYFVTATVGEDDYNRMGYIVNMTQCRIPYIDPWHPRIIPYTKAFKPPVDCGDQLQWTYVNKTTVVLNETAVEESGYLVTQIHCCYRTFAKDPRHFNKITGWYSPVVDSRVAYSATCTPLQNVTEPDSEFIFVTCKPKNWIWYFDERLLSNVVYKNYHALVLKRKGDDVHEKMEYWRQTPNKIPNSPNNRPPNVVVLGIDSTARLYFRRSMPKTIEILNNLGAHEMLGYTKVGDSTFPNMVAFLLGYTNSEFTRACWFNRRTKLDLCPFIWKRFSNANYVTALISDSPRGDHWNLEKVGFVEKPTSFYIRQYLLGIHMDAGFYPNRVECVGRQPMLDILFTYMKDIIEYTQDSTTPLFMMTWFCQLAHDFPNTLQFSDSSFAKLLEWMIVTRFLDNTILIVAGDHGARYGDLRETLNGYYEDKLPNMWIRLPAWVIEKYNEWEFALKHNTKMLSSTFHIYQAFNQILDTFSNTSEIVGVTTQGSTIPRRYGQSLLRPIPANTSCVSSGIPESFCACDFPLSLPQSSEVLKQAAQASIEYLNKILPTECSRLALLQVKGGASIMKRNQNNPNYLKSKIIVEFTTEPGEFVLEATVIRQEHNSTSGNSDYEVESDIQRVSKFKTDANCVSDPKMKLYCFC